MIAFAPREKPQTSSTRVPEGAKAIRFRAFALIVLAQFLLTSWIADSEIARGVYIVCYSLMMPTVLYLLFARVLSRWFTRQEILLGYIVLTATLPLVSFGGLRFVMSGMGHLAYFSESQPSWARYLGHLPTLPVLHDSVAIRGFYLGNHGMIPWSAWIAPIAFWSTYLLLLAGVWLGLAALLNRVWIRHERLSFPIAVLPLQITDPQDDLFRRGLFWLGAAIPVVFQSLLAVHEWYPSVPCVTLKAIDLKSLLFDAPPWNAIPNLNVSLYPMAVGLAYFVPSTVSFSCWFFWIATRLLSVFGAIFGLGISGGAGAASRFPFPQEQAAGAWIAFGLFTLFSTRRHFAQVLRDLAAADRHLLIRWGGAAAICAGLCILMMGVAGVPLLLAAGILLIYIAFVVTAARIRAEAGGMWTMSSVVLTPFKTALATSGTIGIPEQGLVAGAHFDMIHVEVRGQSLPYLMEGLKIADTLGIKWRTVLVWVGLGTITALGFGWWSSLSEFYTVGAATAKSDPYIVAKAQTLLSGMHNAATNRTPWDAPGVEALAASGAFTLLLFALRSYFPTFPFHPVGYVACNTHTMTAFFVPFFISWLTKELLLRYGGAAAFRRVTPLFVGLVVGDIFIQGFWTVIGRLIDLPVYSFLV